MKLMRSKAAARRERLQRTYEDVRDYSFDLLAIADVEMQEDTEALAACGVLLRYLQRRIGELPVD